jgi:hypothetical protein
MLEHHPNGALAHLRRKLRRIPGLVHCSILSKERASGKPGAVHYGRGWRVAGTAIVLDAFIRCSGVQFSRMKGLGPPVSRAYPEN